VPASSSPEQTNPTSLFYVVNKTGVESLRDW
jgi:hypothetical protein